MSVDNDDVDDAGTGIIEFGLAKKSVDVLQNHMKALNNIEKSIKAMVQPGSGGAFSGKFLQVAQQQLIYTKDIAAGIRQLNIQLTKGAGLARQQTKLFNTLNQKSVQNLLVAFGKQSGTPLKQNMFGKIFDFFKGLPGMLMSGLKKGFSVISKVWEKTGGALFKKTGSMGMNKLLGLGGASVIGALVGKMISSSPLLQAMFKIMNTSLTLIMRPIGDFFGAFLRPMSIYFLKEVAIPFFQKGRTWMKEGEKFGRVAVGFFVDPVMAIQSAITLAFKDIPLLGAGISEKAIAMAEFFQGDPAAWKRMKSGLFPEETFPAHLMTADQIAKTELVAEETAIQKKLADIEKELQRQSEIIKQKQTFLASPTAQTTADNYAKTHGMDSITTEAFFAMFPWLLPTTGGNLPGVDQSTLTGNWGLDKEQIMKEIQIGGSSVIGFDAEDKYKLEEELAVNQAKQGEIDRKQNSIWRGFEMMATPMNQRAEKFEGSENIWDLLVMNSRSKYIRGFGEWAEKLASGIDATTLSILPAAFALEDAAGESEHYAWEITNRLDNASNVFLRQGNSQLSYAEQQEELNKAIIAKYGMNLQQWDESAEEHQYALAALHQSYDQIKKGAERNYVTTATETVARRLSMDLNLGITEDMIKAARFSKEGVAEMLQHIDGAIRTTYATSVALGRTNLMITNQGAKIATEMMNVWGMGGNVNVAGLEQVVEAAMAEGGILGGGGTKAWAETVAASKNDGSITGTYANLVANYEGAVGSASALTPNSMQRDPEGNLTQSMQNFYHWQNKETGMTFKSSSLVPNVQIDGKIVKDPAWEKVYDSVTAERVAKGYHTDSIQNANNALAKKKQEKIGAMSMGELIAYNGADGGERGFKAAADVKFLQNIGQLDSNGDVPAAFKYLNLQDFGWGLESPTGDIDVSSVASVKKYTDTMAGITAANAGTAFGVAQSFAGTFGTGDGQGTGPSQASASIGGGFSGTRGPGGGSGPGGGTGGSTSGGGTKGTGGGKGSTSGGSRGPGGSSGASGGGTGGTGSSGASKGTGGGKGSNKGGRKGGNAQFGGIIDEPIIGIGQHSGGVWNLGESGPELVTPLSQIDGQGNVFVMNVHIGNISKEADYIKLKPLVQRWMLEASSRRGMV